MRLVNVCSCGKNGVFFNSNFPLGTSKFKGKLKLLSIITIINIILRENEEFIYYASLFFSRNHLQRVMHRNTADNNLTIRKRKSFV